MLPTNVDTKDKCFTNNLSYNKIKVNQVNLPFNKREMTLNNTNERNIIDCNEGNIYLVYSTINNERYLPLINFTRSKIKTKTSVT